MSLVRGASNSGGRTPALLLFPNTKMTMAPVERDERVVPHHRYERHLLPQSSYLNDLSWIVERVIVSLKVFLTMEAIRAKSASKIL